MSKNSKICPNCGRSWKHDMGYFERTNDMVFALQRVKIGKKVKQMPIIRIKERKENEYAE